MCLNFFLRYIECHMRNKQYSYVFEIVNQVDLCKLNSEDPNECIEIVKEWPLGTININHGKHCCFSLIAEICLMKCQLFKELGYMVSCRKCADFLTTIYQELHKEMQKSKSMIPQTQYDYHLLSDYDLFSIINGTLTLLQTVCEPHERKRLFKWLFCLIIFDSHKRCPVYYIRRTMKDYFIDLDDVLPFLQFCIKECSSDETLNLMAAHCAKKSGNKDPNEANSEAILYLQATKDSMATFKNSLLINTHFKDHFIVK